MLFCTDQKAWRKKQLCYKLSRKNICHSVVTDIILLGRNKRPPDGFTYVGYVYLYFIHLSLLMTIFEKNLWLKVKFSISWVLQLNEIMFFVTHSQSKLSISAETQLCDTPKFIFSLTSNWKNIDPVWRRFTEKISFPTHTDFSQLLMHGD